MANFVDEGGVSAGLPFQTPPTQEVSFVETMNNWAKAFDNALNATPPGIGTAGSAGGFGVTPPIAPVPSIAPPSGSLGYAPGEFRTPAYGGYNGNVGGAGAGGIGAPTNLSQRTEYSQYTGGAPMPAVNWELGGLEQYRGNAALDQQSQMFTDYMKQYRKQFGEPDTADRMRMWNAATKTETPPTAPTGTGGGWTGTGGPGGYTYTPTNGTPSGQTGTGGIIAPTTAPTGTAASAEPNLWPFIAGDTLTFYENDLSMLPEDIRPYVDQVLRTLGYLPTGYYGNYGSKEYVRQPGSPRTILNDATISAIAGGDARKLAWLKWFMARKGLTGAQANYPGITAPTATG